MATADVLSTFAQPGAVFNDMTRQLEEGLWQNVAEEEGRGLGYSRCCCCFADRDG